MSSDNKWNHVPGLPGWEKSDDGQMRLKKHLFEAAGDSPVTSNQPAFQDEVDTHQKGIDTKPYRKVDPKAGMSPIVYQDDVEPELREMMKDRMYDAHEERLPVEHQAPKINPRLLSVALLGEDVVGNDPEAEARIEDELTWLNVEQDIKDSAKTRRWEEQRKDVEIGRRIGESLMNQARVLKHDAQEDRKRMERIVTREMESRIMFVPMDDDDPRAGAKRALMHQSMYPDCEIEPVSLKGALDGVEPLTENFINHLHPFMTLTAPTDEFPEEIRLSVPDAELLFSDVDGTSYPNQCIEFDVQRYVHLNPMPEALKRVIRCYLALLRCEGGMPAGNLKDFKNAVRDLNNEAHITFGTDEELEATG